VVYPIGDFKLAALFTDRLLGMTATARDWSTVSRLLEVSGG
jgi:hypothetical protein